MQCNWMGRAAQPMAEGIKGYTLITHPMRKINQELLRQIAKAAEIECIDIKIRAQPGGFFIVRRDTNKHSLDAASPRWAGSAPSKSSAPTPR